MIIASAHSAWPTGPFSAVRPGEQREWAQDPAESSAPEPVDEVAPPREPTSGASRGPSSQAMAEMGRSSAAAALTAFPQIVHVLANPELHLGQGLAKETGLPVVSLAEVAVEELQGVLAQPQYAEGFILEGFPQTRASAEALDGLLSATNPNERRVLGFEATSDAQQEIQDHYIDQGLLWLVPAPAQDQTPDQVKSTLLECLVGLPALQ